MLKAESLSHDSKLAPYMPLWTKLRLWNTAAEVAAAFSATREPQTNEVFLDACGAPPHEDAKRVALAVRRAVAGMLRVEPEFIRGGDRGSVELRTLWDSVDFVEWIMRVEDELNVTIRNTAFNALPRHYTIRHLILCVYFWRAES